MKSINKLRSLVPNFKCFLDFHSNPESSWTLQKDFNIFVLGIKTSNSYQSTLNITENLEGMF